MTKPKKSLPKSFKELNDRHDAQANKDIEDGLQKIKDDTLPDITIDRSEEKPND